MKRSIYIVILALTAFACSKNDGTPDATFVKDIRVLGPYGGAPSFVLAGDDFYCMDATKITEWGSPTGYLIFADENGAVQTEIEAIAAKDAFFNQEDNTVTLFYFTYNRLRISTQGQLIDTISNFLQGLEPVPSGQTLDYTYETSGIKRLSDGKYVAYGHISRLNRAFFTLHSADGTLIFKKIYLQGAPEMNAFTGFVEQIDGTYLLYGCHNSNSQDSPTKLFLVAYDENGDLINEAIIDYDQGPIIDDFAYSESYIFSKELIAHSNGTYTCVVNRPDPSAPGQYVELLNVTLDGEILNRQILDFAPNNVAVEFTTRAGQSNYGIISQTAIDFDSRPAYSYWVELDPSGNYVQHQTVDQRSNASLTALTIRNNQELVLAGGLRSFGDSLKPYFTNVQP